MASEGSRALAKELGAAPPAGVLETLNDAELGALGAEVRAARHRQSAALQAAGDKALGQLPWLVRGAVRRIVGA